MITKKFPLGMTVAIKGVLCIFDELELSQLLARHNAGDWGDLCQEDKELNEAALLSTNNRLFSSYSTPKGKVWIITEYDRSATTILLPNEY